MALYEHLLIARQDISAQQVDALATHLKTIVEGEGGKIEKQEYWGLRGLAYRIKKNRKGHYVLLNINAPAPAVIELERQLKINEDVLRYLTVKVDQFDVSSSTVDTHLSKKLVLRSARPPVSLAIALSAS